MLNDPLFSGVVLLLPARGLCFGGPGPLEPLPRLHPLFPARLEGWSLPSLLLCHQCLHGKGMQRKRKEDGEAASRLEE